MMRCETIFDLRQAEDRIRQHRYGMIETRDGRFHALRFRRWPKLVSLPELWWDGADRTFGATRAGDRDRCRLYYDQPWGSPDYLALKYVVSSPGASFASFRRAVLVLDEIARIKRSHAIVCEASNRRISDRLLARWGWERHVHSSRRRHYIKRFYGSYPPSRVDELGLLA